MTAERVIVRKSTYFDSVSLMLASRDVGRAAGVDSATALQATPLNVGLLEDEGFSLPDELGPNDLVIAIKAQDEAALEEAVAQLESSLIQGAEATEKTGERAVRSWREMKRERPSTSLGVVAVPGRYAAGECAAALEAGLDVFCFSDGVPVEHEISLKRWAVGQNRLLMGPDCGTAIIGGVGLGFANRVDSGPVGIVGASGTGTQEICALLDRAGIGISHAIGVGSRDLSADVGGLMTLHALDLLETDETTEVIVLVSKPPDPAIAGRVAERASKLKKPVAIAWLGPDTAGDGTGTVSGSMEAAVAQTCRLLDRPVPEPVDTSLPATEGLVRGLFCGGTLCYQAQLVLWGAGIKARSNVPLDPDLALEDPWTSESHTFIDFGEDTFTDGRLHPMIDPSLRDERVRLEMQDPDVGVILCDIVLGDGAHPDPAADLAGIIAGSVRTNLRFVVTLCGTSRDPQGLDRQAGLLEEAGAVVARSSESAARSVVAALGGAT